MYDVSIEVFPKEVDKMKLPQNIRKALRTVFRGLGVTAVSFIFQSCYGMPPDWGDDVTIRGTVKSEKTRAGIHGIVVSIEGTTFYEQTDFDGFFSIYMPRQDYYTVKFEDIDGPENGGSFKQQTKKITTLEGESSLSVYLEEADEE